MDYLRELLCAHNIQGCIGEVGTDAGEGSTRVLWDYAQNNDSRFFAVDTFTDETKFQKVKKQLNHPETTCFKGFSTQIAKKWSDTIDFLFIDGDHNFPHVSPCGHQSGVMYDIMAWHPYIAVGGIMAFHDYEGTRQEFGQMPLMAVEYAVDTLMNPPAYKWIGRNDSIIAFQKISNQLLNPSFVKKKLPQSHGEIWKSLDEISNNIDTIIIYGAGASGKLAYDSIHSHWSELPEIIFTDTFTSEKSVIFDDRPLIPLNDINNYDKNSMFVIGSLYEDQISEILSKMGKIHLKDYFTLFEFVSWCHLGHLIGERS